MNETPLISLVILLRNEEEHVEDCIKSLLKQTYKNIEILLIEGMSDDRTPEIIKKFEKKHKNIFIYVNKAKKTPQARNLGIVKSKGKYVMFIGGHSYLESDVVEKLYNTIRTADKNVVGAGGVTSSPEKTFFEKLTTQTFNTIIGGTGTSYRSNEKKLRETKSVFSCMFKRNVLEEVKIEEGVYYDPYFVKGQDYDLCWRLRKKGYKFLKNPNAKIYYYKRKEFKSLFKQMIVYSFWRAKLMIKHKEIETPVFMMPSIFFTTLLILFIVGIFENISLLIGLSILSIYFLILLIFSTYLVIKNKSIKYFASIVIYLCIHIGYAVGFIKGLVFKNNYTKDRVSFR